MKRRYVTGLILLAFLGLCASVSANPDKDRDITGQEKHRGRGYEKAEQRGQGPDFGDDHEHGRSDYDHPEKKGGGPPPWAPAHGYRAKHEYRYYPSEQVYYEESRNVYFYRSDGKWHVSADLPEIIGSVLGDSVHLEMDTERPYQHHQSVVEHYPPGWDE